MSRGERETLDAVMALRAEAAAQQRARARRRAKEALADMRTTAAEIRGGLALLQEAGWGAVDFDGLFEGWDMEATDELSNSEEEQEEEEEEEEEHDGAARADAWHGPLPCSALGGGAAAGPSDVAPLLEALGARPFRARAPPPVPGTR